MAYIYNLLDTWNDAGTTFTSIKMSVTDTASNAASLLMDLQVGGVSQFKVSKAGVATAASFAANGTETPRSYALGNSTNARGLEFFTGGNRLYYRDGASAVMSFGNSTGFMLANNQPLGWAATSPDGTADLTLFRDGAANTLAQRNGVNAQTSRIYNTYTDASNYERGVAGWISNVFTIGAQSAGTGVARTTAILSQNVNMITQSGTGTTGRIRLWDTTNTGTFDVYPKDASGNSALDASGNIAFLKGIFLPAGTTAKASINIASGVAPTSPVNGDIWFDGTNLFMRIGGVTKTFTII